VWRGSGWRAATCVLALLMPCGFAASWRRHNAAPSPPAIRSSQAPSFSIPAEPLGFAAPGALYQGMRYAFVSLDFLDENRLLFTFRAPGLLRRQQGGESGQRQIRALVVHLPDGAVEAESLWTMHDQARYLWMLDGGRYLVRDGASLLEGDATLGLKPKLHFPGPLEWVETDPERKLLIASTNEPEDAPQGQGDVASPATAQATMSGAEEAGQGKPPLVLRILERASGRVMLVSRVRTIVHLPLTREGYLESLRGREREWLLNFQEFTGDNRILARVQSTCTPSLDFLTAQIFTAGVCDGSGGRTLMAISLDGRKQWAVDSPPEQVWPRMMVSQNGKLMALETLVVNHAVTAFEPLDFADVKGQLVEIFDVATGKRLLAAPANPVLDGGGNVALSPDGRRVAVLNGGSIEVYDVSAGTAPAASPR